ncbi:MAG: S41 family peptidase [Bacteroidota bacterium]|nr:S41 family peptidase [Bacteroidota bacterium]
MNYRNSKFSIWLPVIISLSVVGGILLGNLAQRNAMNQRPLRVFSPPDKISSILNFVETNYVDSVDRKSLNESLVSEILKQLDPHSIYLPPRDLAVANETLRGNFDGIGVQFNMVEDTILVIRAINGGPSEKVGIMAGDRIVAVNDTIVAGVKMPEDSIIGMLRGLRNSKVRVGIQRKNVEDELEFTITRGKIPLYSIDVSYMVTSEIGYIKTTTFSQSTYSEFETHLKKLRDEGCTKLILDLRDNGGGIMGPAIKLSDDFLPENSLIVYTEGHSRPREDFFSTKNQLGKDLELVILIDEGSASASEIVAGAIQDNDRGTIIGRRSFGKGLVQEQATLSDGSAIRLTTARYYTPTGRSIQKPYENGKTDYYMDIHRRFQQGEFLEKDSIHLPDSLKFITHGGKIVYGGGGIMPDVFVPYDTVGVTNYLRRVTNLGLVYKMALRYADNHRDELSIFKTGLEINNYLKKQKLKEEFLAFIKENNGPAQTSQFAESEEIILTQLKAYIARNILDNDGFYPIILQIDTTLKAAIRVLSGDNS